MRVLNIRNAIVGWVTMELGKRALKRQLRRLPWRTQKRTVPWRMLVAGAAGAVGMAWLTRKLTAGGDDTPGE
jgi:hypothetical protein